MGRGLSELQKIMLEMGYQHRKKGMSTDLRQSWIIENLAHTYFGIPNLNSMKASISRAVARLVRRGLMVNLGNEGLMLTEEGLKLGEEFYRLTVEKIKEERRERRLMK
jgi:hypothetical protein